MCVVSGARGDTIKVSVKCDENNPDHVRIGKLCFNFKHNNNKHRELSADEELPPDEFNDDVVVLESFSSPSYSQTMIHWDDDEYNLDNYYSGKDVEIFVLDTGLTHTHEEFLDERASAPVESIMTGESSHDDVHGHGTHVSGCAAGLLYGAAHGADVISVKVMTNEGGGSVSSVVRGIAWVLANAKKRGIVINMSLSTSTNGALNNAVDAATEEGAIVVVAAGNQGKNASERSPASARTAITVGAVGESKNVQWWSNTGPDVNIFAPGYKILAAKAQTDNVIEKKSGTSMASPIVAGAAALFLEKHGYDPIAARADLLMGTVERDTLTMDPDRTVEGTPNKLVRLPRLSDPTPAPTTSSPTSLPTLTPTNSPTTLTPTNSPTTPSPTSSPTEGTFACRDVTYEDGPVILKSLDNVTIHTHGHGHDFTVGSILPGAVITSVKDYTRRRSYLNRFYMRFRRRPDRRAAAYIRHLENFKKIKVVYKGDRDAEYDYSFGEVAGVFLDGDTVLDVIDVSEFVDMETLSITVIRADEHGTIRLCSLL